MLGDFCKFSLNTRIYCVILVLFSIHRTIAGTRDLEQFTWRQTGLQLREPPMDATYAEYPLELILSITRIFFRACIRPIADRANVIRVGDDIRIQHRKIRSAIPNRGAFLLASRAVVFFLNYGA